MRDVSTAVGIRGEFNITFYVNNNNSPASTEVEKNLGLKMVA